MQRSHGGRIYTSGGVANPLLVGGTVVQVSVHGQGPMQVISVLAALGAVRAVDVGADSDDVRHAGRSSSSDAGRHVSVVHSGYGEFSGGGRVKFPEPAAVNTTVRTTCVIATRQQTQLPAEARRA
jgi:hypothetical protein